MNFDLESDKYYDPKQKTTNNATNSWLKTEITQAFIFLIAITLAVSIPALFLAKQAGLCPGGKAGRGDIDRGSCSCTCWDGQFKGCYDFRSSYGTDYHHVMFNLTQETYWLALLTAFYFVLMTQSLKFILNLVLDQILVLLYGTTSKEDQSPSSSICWLTFLAFASTFFPNIYGWWMWFNYINDEFVTFVATQLFFSVTELFSTFILYSFLDESSNKIPQSIKRDLYLIPLTISAAHITISWSNFISNWRSGNSSLIARDALLLGTDAIVVFCCIIKWIRLRSTQTLAERNGKRSPMIAISAGLYLGLLFWFYYGIASNY